MTLFSTFAYVRHCLIAAALVIFTPHSLAADTGDTRQLLRLAEYIGADYDSAVNNGVIISEGEFAEMDEFSALIVSQVEILDSSIKSEQIVTLANDLRQAVLTKASPESVIGIASNLRSELLKLSPAINLPAQFTAPEKVEAIFSESCASCHGATGRGDGVLAANFEPAPTDFTDLARAKNRSLMGLYDTLTNGIEGTAMASFKNLSEEDRWALVFFVGSLATVEASDVTDLPASVPVTDFVSATPASLVEANSELTLAAIFNLRKTPEQLVKAPENPLSVTREKLESAMALHSAGQIKEAQQVAVSAYLDGFELAENSLVAHDSKLTKDIETSMMKFRQLVSKSGTDTELTQEYSTLLSLIAQAETLLSEHTLSSVTLFFASLIILLREGLEAILVVIALWTILVRSQRQDALKYVHFGWVTALVCGGLTWWIAQNLIAISGASREVVEGVAALFAAIVLFYVGYWMHGKAQADEWQKYINTHLSSHLSAGTLWGIALLSFVAVYREVFETVLFYQSLLTQAGQSQYGSVAWGLITGAGLLAVIAWVFIKYSIKLPISKFLSMTTYLLLALAFILMGKAMGALQEAGIVSASTLPIDFSFSWLGINSTWESIGAQLIIILLSIVLVRRGSKSKDALANTNV